LNYEAIVRNMQKFFIEVMFRKPGSSSDFFWKYPRKLKNENNVLIYTLYSKDYAIVLKRKGQGHAVALLKYELKRSHSVPKLMGQDDRVIRLKIS
jgi:hypothetical protein